MLRYAVLAYHDITTRQILHDEVEPLLVLQKTANCEVSNRDQETVSCYEEDHEGAGVVLWTKVQGVDKKAPQGCVLPRELVCKLAVFNASLTVKYTVSPISPSAGISSTQARQSRYGPS